jgi:hypothetical protein
MKNALRNTTWTQRLLAALFLVAGYAAGGLILLAISVAVLALLVKPLGPGWEPMSPEDYFASTHKGMADKETDLLDPSTPGCTLSGYGMFDE